MAIKVMLGKIIKNEKGQTLLEMIIALSILVVSLVATIILMVTSINAGRQGINRLVATNLAKEGIEVVRDIRDSNWIDPSDPAPAWDEGITSIGDNTAIPQILGGNNAVSLNFSVNDINDTTLTAIKKFNNEFYQGSGASGDNAGFYRILYINLICQKDDGTEEIVGKSSTADCSSFGNGSDYHKVGVRVISEVDWPRPGKSRLIVEDRLYDWQML